MEPTPDRISEPRGRLLAALARDGVALVAHKGPVSMLEVLGAGAGVVVVDAADLPVDDLRRLCAQVVEGHQAGLLALVVAGGSDAVPPLLTAVDEAAPHRSQLGVYHLPAAGPLRRVAGRRMSSLEHAARGLDAVAPVGAEDVRRLVEQAQAERQEAIAFATTMSGRRSRATIAMIVACVVLYTVLDAHFSDRTFGLALAVSGANSAPLVHGGEVWRLLSYAFLHGGITHLFMNMLALHGFGTFLERVIGWRRFVIAYVLAAIAGGLASVFIGGVQLSVGASGALSGLFGVGLGIVLLRRELLPARVGRVLRQRLVFLFVINGFISLMPGIDLWAHVGGAVVGFALAGSGLLTPRPQGEPRVVTIAAVVLLALCAAAVAAALFTGRPWLLPSDGLLG